MLLKTNTIVLPISKIKCEIGVSLFDKIEIEKAKTKVASLYFEVYDEKGKLIQKLNDENEPLFSKLRDRTTEYAKIILTKTIKKWDNDEPLTWEVLQNIENEDYETIKNEVEKIITKINKPLTVKKNENT